MPTVEGESYRVPARIIVAEPLSFQVKGGSGDWLANYRSNLRRMLNRYEAVEFLPEPFAVYQYYRHGLRILNLVERKKHIALILDYGGGTFDACVIESTREGDISLSGKHSKPIAADSVPYGGFYLNRRLALYLIKRNLDDQGRRMVDQEFKRYERVRKGGLEIEKLREGSRTFINNFRQLEWRCEAYKLELSSRIAQWGLEEEGYDKIEVEVPENPFSDNSLVPIDLFSHQLRKVFIDDIWNQKLSPVVRNVLSRASDELSGKKQIGVTLISGGSANLGWLRKLLVKDFAEQLKSAEPVNIQHSFQEVVANGLAIECARRFFNKESEFVAVTYNPIKLFLGTGDGNMLTKS